MISPWEQLRILAKVVAVPTVFVGVVAFLMIVDNTSFYNVFRVIKKEVRAPGRNSIVIKTDPNVNRGTLTTAISCPKWLFDRVQLGDTCHSGLGHIRVARNGRFVALYVPWKHIFPMAWVPLAWCLPGLLWFHWPSCSKSTPVLIIALASELSFLAACGCVCVAAIARLFGYEP
jgi:hypothetical protein